MKVLNPGSDHDLLIELLEDFIEQKKINWRQLQILNDYKSGFFISELKQKYGEDAEEELKHVIRLVAVVFSDRNYLKQIKPEDRKQAIKMIREFDGKFDYMQAIS